MTILSQSGRFFYVPVSRVHTFLAINIATDYCRGIWYSHQLLKDNFDFCEDCSFFAYDKTSLHGQVSYLTQVEHQSHECLSINKVVIVYKDSRKGAQIQRIVDKKVGKKGTMYKVKWQGYSMNDCTWQPQENLKYVKNLVIAYEQSQPRQKSMASQPILDPYAGSTIEHAATNEEEENMEAGNGQEESQQEKLEDEQMEEFNSTLEAEADYEEDEVYEEPQPPKTQRKRKDYDASQDNYQAKPPKNKQPSQNQHKFKHKPSQNQSYYDSSKHTAAQKPRELSLQGQKLKKLGQNLKLAVTKPKKSPSQPKVPTQLKILEMSRCEKSNQYVFMCQEQELLLYRSRSFMLQNFPDELIRFYESKIEFANIPKIAK